MIYKMVSISWSEECVHEWVLSMGSIAFDIKINENSLLIAAT